MTQVLRTRQAGQPAMSWSERGRGAAATLWLSLLFRLTSLAPGLLVAAQPLFVRLAFLCSRKIRRSTDANARWILGTGATTRRRREFGLGVVRSFYEFVIDIGRSLEETPEELRRRIASAEGEAEYHRMRAEGKGAILLTAHMGSFEVGLAALAAHEKRIHVVFKRDQVSGFERLRKQLRERLGVAEAPIDDGFVVWSGLRGALLNNEVVAIQGDRVMPGQKGVVVPFLQGHLLLPTGPFKLALASGSPIVPIFSVRNPDGKIRIFLEQAITVSEEADGIASAIAKFADCLARYVSRYPEQWLVLEKAFWEDRCGAEVVEAVS